MKYLVSCIMMKTIANLKNMYVFFQISQVSFADKNDIKVIVLLKDKLYQTKNKAFVRYKKDKNTKVDKEFSLEEFTTFLHKNIPK